jgi:hypothetical protein
MDAYHFGRGVTQALLDHARDKEHPEGPVRFTTALVGAWDFFAVLDVEDGDFDAVKDLLLDLNEAVGDTRARPFDSTTAISVGLAQIGIGDVPAVGPTLETRGIRSTPSIRP